MRAHLDDLAREVAQLRAMVARQRERIGDRQPDVHSLSRAERPTSAPGRSARSAPKKFRRGQSSASTAGGIWRRSRTRSTAYSSADNHTIKEEDRRVDVARRGQRKARHIRWSWPPRPRRKCLCAAGTAERTTTWTSRRS